MNKVMFITFTHMLHCFFQMIPSGQVWRCVVINGRPVYLSYGGRETRRIAQQHGTQVMMQPDTCYLMREQELVILHVGSSWTRVPGQMLWSSLLTLEMTRSCLTSSGSFPLDTSLQTTYRNDRDFLTFTTALVYDAC